MGKKSSKKSAAKRASSDVAVSVSEIDKALAAAKGRLNKRETLTGESKPVVKAKKVVTEKRSRLSDEEKASREIARSLRVAAVLAKRTEKAAARLAAKVTPHMKKLERAASKLPELNGSASEALRDLTSNFSSMQLAALAQHLMHFNRVQSTNMAVASTSSFKVGDEVTIARGNSRFVGQSATVVKVQRIRAYVKVAGQAKDVYLFTSDLQAQVAVEQADAEVVTGTNG